MEKHSKMRKVTRPQLLAQKLISVADLRPASWRTVLTHTHMYSGELRPPVSYRNLAKWAAAAGVDALGVGSPFTTETAAMYGKFEEESRGLYYSGDFDQQSVKYPDKVQQLIADLNRHSRGRTLFYLDNETPKARYGHIWWVGWHHDFPDWHDYDQPFDRWMTRLQLPTNRQPEPMPYQRRPYMEIVGMQRTHGALAFWAHPTSWWRNDRGAFITNIASEMPAHLVADGMIDGLVIMGYDPYRPSYLELWFSLLDHGYRVTGVAETDKGLSTAKVWDSKHTMLTHVHTGARPLDLAGVKRGLQRGRVYSSSGPFVEILVDGQPMGGVVPTAAGRTHRVEIRAGPALGRIELLGKSGRRLWHSGPTLGGTFTLQVPGSATPTYLVARVFGDLPESKPARDVNQFAVSNPVYLHPRGTRFPAPATTALTLAFDAQSPYLGGEVWLETASGERLAKHKIRAGKLRVTMPASGRFTLVSMDGWRQTHYLINANPAVTRLQRYLYRGQFLADFPDLPIGDVPAQAFNIPGFQRALRELQLSF